jgi:ribonuclease G
MKSKLLITTWNQNRIAALVENDRICEIHPELPDNEVALHNIYIGKVEKVIPSQEAAYVEVSKGISCFLKLSGNRKVKGGELLTVQVDKEASSLKKAVVTEKIVLTGRYCVVSLDHPGISFSSRLSGEEKRRWKSILSESDIHILIRTAAAQADEERVLNEIRYLSDYLCSIRENGQQHPAYTCLYREDFYIGCLRGLPEENTEIITDLSDVYETIRVHPFLPADWKIRMYDDSSVSLGNLYQLNSTVENILREKVWLKNGGFLIIQRTEGLNVIDVNSGKNIRGKEKEKTSYRTNLEAASEAAFQMRLRNLSGIIIIDFINMKEDSYRESCLDQLKTELDKDPISTKFIDMTALQLAEITRRKTGVPVADVLNRIKRNRR